MDGFVDCAETDRSNVVSSRSGDRIRVRTHRHEEQLIFSQDRKLHGIREERVWASEGTARLHRQSPGRAQSAPAWTLSEAQSDWPMHEFAVSRGRLWVPSRRRGWQCLKIRFGADCRGDGSGDQRDAFLPSRGPSVHASINASGAQSAFRNPTLSPPSTIVRPPAPTLPQAYPASLRRDMSSPAPVAAISASASPTPAAGSKPVSKAGKPASKAAAAKPTSKRTTKPRSKATTTAAVAKPKSKTDATAKKAAAPKKKAAAATTKDASHPSWKEMIKVRFSRTLVVHHNLIAL